MIRNALRILLVEDDAGDAILAERALDNCADRFEVRHVETLAGALQTLASARIDIVLLDLSLPDSFGLSGIERILEQAPDISIVVLTGLNDGQSALAALERGAQDYLIKGEWSAESLKRTLHYARQRNAIVQENQRLLHELTRQARFDGVTQLLNRQALATEFEREWSRAARSNVPLSCVMMDVDFFKRINDTHGHLAGDSVLRAIGDCLRRECRVTDYGARYGGEEFCVLLPDTDEEGALVWAERTRLSIEVMEVRVDDGVIPITASFGVAQRNELSTSPAQLVDQADQALLVAKRTGRNRVQRFSEIVHVLGDRLAAQTDKLAAVTAVDVMTPMVATLTRTHTLVDVARYLFELRVDSAAIVDDHGNLLGIIGEEDLVGPLSANATSTLPLTDVMNQRPACFPTDTSARVIYDFLRRVSMRRVLIVDNQRPCGVVSRTNLLRWLCNDLAGRPIAMNAGADSTRQPPAARATLMELEQRIQVLLASYNDDDPRATDQIIAAGSQMQALIEELMAHAPRGARRDGSVTTLQSLLG